MAVCAPLTHGLLGLVVIVVVLSLLHKERSCFENAIDGFSSLKYDCKLKINKIL